jgi:hypothetical protein
MHKKKKAIVLALTSLALGLVMVALAATKRNVHPVPMLQQTGAASTAATRRNYVRRSTLQSQLGWALSKLGDRLERPGKERTAATGTIQLAEGLTPQPVALLNEFPDRVRVSVNEGGTQKTLIFDGNQARAVSQLSGLDEALLETLVYDSAEHFFWSQTQQLATRFIGSRIRTDDGSRPDYSGPYYEVYQLASPVKIGRTEQLRFKFYYFNSDTLLLERVIYQSTNESGSTNVEVRLTEWTSINNQSVPHRIERIENGTSKFVFSLNSVNISPRLDDGTFDNSASN